MHWKEENKSKKQHEVSLQRPFKQKVIQGRGNFQALFRYKKTGERRRGRKKRRFRAVRVREEKETSSERHELQELEGAAPSKKRERETRKASQNFWSKTWPEENKYNPQEYTFLESEKIKKPAHMVFRGTKFSGNEREKCVKEGVERKVQDDRKFKTPFHIPFFTNENTFLSSSQSVMRGNRPKGILFSSSITTHL